MDDVFEDSPTGEGAIRHKTLKYGFGGTVGIGRELCPIGTWDLELTYVGIDGLTVCLSLGLRHEGSGRRQQKTGERECVQSVLQHSFLLKRFTKVASGKLQAPSCEFPAAWV